MSESREHPTIELREEYELHEQWTTPGIEVRAAAGQPPRFVGYAAVFNSRSERMGGPVGGFVEYVRPGAFAASLAAKRDIVALVEHDPKAILGRWSRGTLTLAEDERGLRVEILPADTSIARDAMENVRAGNLQAMSFGFVTRADKWDHSQAPHVRELLAVDVHDVSLVAMPAYPKTEVALRSLAESLARQHDPHLKNETLRRKVRLLDLERVLTGTDRLT